MALLTSFLLAFCTWSFIPDDTEAKSFDQLDSFTDSLLREVMARMGGELSDQPEDYLSLHHTNADLPRVAKQFDGHMDRFRPRHDGILGKEPSIRDQEYLEHSSLWGHQYMQGGAGEGTQRLKPDGSMKNVQVVKTDGVLPAYCNPPNPCPIGYTSADGCLEEFMNTAAFSREFQAAQECMCDTEHMFDCPGATQENEIDALARSISNEGLTDSTLDRIVQNMQIEGEHKNLVAKKFFTSKRSNPYLQGEKLPVVAKKTPRA